MARSRWMGASAAGGRGAAFSAARPTLLPFGCSITGVAGRQLWNSTTVTSTAVRTGSQVIPVASAAAFVVGGWAQVALCTAEPWMSRVTAVDTAATPNTVTIADPLPESLLPNNPAHYQAASVSTPSNQHIKTGLWVGASAELGGVVEVLPAYSYTGARQDAMLPALARLLRLYRPKYVALNLVENDVNGSVSLPRIVELSRQAVRSCLNAGATPLVCSCVPATQFSDSRSSLVEGYLSWVRQVGSELPGAVGVDLTTPWRDASLPGYQPLAGYTDGIHPSAPRWHTTAQPFVSVLRQLEGERPSLADLALTYWDMSGAGGTAASLQAGSVVPTSWTISAEAGVIATTTKVANDKPRIQYSVPGASNASTTRLFVRQPNVAIPDYYVGKYLTAFMKARFDQIANLSMAVMSLTFNSGEVVYWGNYNGQATDPALVGRTLVMETPAFRVPANATTMTLELALRPLNIASPSGVSVDMTIDSAGLLPASAGNSYDNGWR